MDILDKLHDAGFKTGDSRFFESISEITHLRTENEALRKSYVELFHCNQQMVYLSANDPSEFGCACNPSVGHLCGPCFAYKQQTPLRKAFAQPTDTTALEAMIAKAGEVMRERATQAIWPEYYTFREAIRALPGVTLADLKGAE